MTRQEEVDTIRGTVARIRAVRRAIPQAVKLDKNASNTDVMLQKIGSNTIKALQDLLAIQKAALEKRRLAYVIDGKIVDGYTPSLSDLRARRQNVKAGSAEHADITERVRNREYKKSVRDGQALRKAA